jgi:hypothetical protein
MCPATRLLFGASLLLVLLGCTDRISKLVNQRFPPINRTEAALDSLQKAEAGMSAIKAPNLSVYLDDKDISAAVGASLNNLEGINKVGESLGAQRIVVEADVDKAFDDLGARIRGRVRGYVLVSADASSLRLLPILDEVTLRHVETTRTDISVLVPALNSAIRKYLANINGQIKPIIVPLSLTKSFNWNPAQELKTIPGATDISANPLNLHVALTAVAVLIESSGIRAIGTAVSTTGGPTPTELAAMCATSPADLPQIDCSLQPGFFGPVLKAACEAQKSLTLQRAKQERDARNKLCASVVEEARAPPIEPRTEEQFNARYTAYHDSFLAKQQALLDDKDLIDKTHVAVLKTFIGSTINSVLADPAVHVVADIPVQHQTVHQDLNLDPAPDLNCHGSARSCDINQDCSLDACNWPCNGWGPGRFVCEMNKSACQAAAPVKKAGCEADKSRRKLQCEAQKSLEIAGCEVNQGWLNTWGGMKVGHIDVVADVGGKVNLLLSRIQVSRDLSSASANLAVTGVANVDADVHFVPASLGTLACVAEWSGHVHAAGVYANQDLTLAGDVALVDPTSSSPAQIKVTVKKIPITLQVLPPPFFALVTQNPKLVVICSGAVAVETIRAHFGDKPPEISGQYNYDVGPFSQSFEIRPIAISARAPAPSTTALNLHLTPRWSGSVVAFVLGGQGGGR